jgi:hypothetical protein
MRFSKVDKMDSLKKAGVLRKVKVETDTILV